MRLRLQTPAKEMPEKSRLCARNMALRKTSAGLVDFPSAPPDVIHVAETRFRAALDKALADQVAPTLRAFQSANELTKDKSSWPVTGQPPMPRRRKRLRGLGDADEAYFKVRVA